MVAQNSVSTYGVNQFFRFVKGFCYIERIVKSDFLLSEKTYFTSYVHNLFWATISYKYHDLDGRFLKEKLKKNDEKIVWKLS